MQIKFSITLVLSFLLLFGCSAPFPLLEPDEKELNLNSPKSFKTEFITNKGNFTIEVKREYSPLAADRFYYLVKNNYYSNNKFFRVLPNFVVQWGMKGIPEIDSVWKNLGFADETLKLSNTKGSIAFARGGPKSRSNQLFINLRDNTQLDVSDFNGVKGFPAFGNVIEGLDVIESINSEYLQEPNQDSISVKGNSYLERNFPNLDYIISCRIISEE